jgi:hypothetical protein
MRLERFCGKFPKKTAKQIIMERIRCRIKDRFMRFKLSILLIIAFFALSVIGQEEAPIPIGVGSVTGEITLINVSDRYSIELSAGQQLTIQMTATEDSDLDSRLFLFDATGNPLANDDDSAGERDAQIIFVVPITGSYIIEATRFQEEEGSSVGGYELTLSLSSSANDPLSFPPNFAVSYTNTSYGEIISGTINVTNPRRYFVIGSRQGDFVRIELNTLEGDLDANIQLINQNLQVVSRLAQSSPNQKIIFATIPETGWYLIEIQQQTGIGSFSLMPTLVSDTLLTENNLVEASFDETTDTLIFVLNATINERVFVNLRVKDGQGIIPRLTLTDINQNPLDVGASQGAQSRVSMTVPRSGPYVVQVENTGAGSSGTIQLQLHRTPVDIGKLRIIEAEYNQSYPNFISDNSPIRYYHLNGKAGERVTIRMEATGDSNFLDPYIILADATFNELIFNDNVTASRNAQIAQFRLPADGDYYILASREGLAGGRTVGTYVLAITVGELKLETGRLTATLTWEGDADLNLFVRNPDGFTVSWSNPTEPNGGILQIDSNAACQTPSDQPIEHIYWPSTEAGDYTIWVWYQTTCSNVLPVRFTLRLSVDGETILNITSTAEQQRILQPRERFESSIRFAADGTVAVVDFGTITSPSAQQTASQGGDIFLGTGTRTVTGTINDTVYAQFYQFEGTEGERVRITVERITGDLDPMVFLLDSRDVTLANDDDSAGNSNARIEDYILTETGRYVIAVSRYGLRDGTSVGDYRLTLERLE